MLKFYRSNRMGHTQNGLYCQLVSVCKGLLLLESEGRARLASRHSMAEKSRVPSLLVKR